MIDQIAWHIPEKLRNVSGKVFYSGRAAWRRGRPIYLLGFNPGGSPETHPDETVRTHTDFVMHAAPEHWSAYTDESWKGRPAGSAPMQRRVLHLLAQLEAHADETPASNLIFTRARRSAELGAETDDLIDLCWPVHEAVLRLVAPKAIICLGVDAGERVRMRIGAADQVGSFEEANARGWQSLAWRSPTGLLVFGLSHPSVADWTKPQTDPTPMISRIIQDVDRP